MLNHLDQSEVSLSGLPSALPMFPAHLSYLPADLSAFLAGPYFLPADLLAFPADLKMLVDLLQAVFV